MVLWWTSLTGSNKVNGSCLIRLKYWLAHYVLLVFCYLFCVVFYCFLLLIKLKTHVFFIKVLFWFESERKNNSNNKRIKDDNNNKKLLVSTISLIYSNLWLSKNLYWCYYVIFIYHFHVMFLWSENWFWRRCRWLFFHPILNFLYMHEKFNEAEIVNFLYTEFIVLKILMDLLTNISLIHWDLIKFLKISDNLRQWF